MADEGVIRAGVGGWVFEPWRGVFYPPGLKQAEELSFASRRLTAIEINATYYSSQKPETFAKWAASTPDGFVFSVKGSRFCTNRRVLAEARPSVEKFLDQGLAELGDRLGPVVWQFMPTKRFEAEDFARFLDLLPDRLGDRPLRHVLEVRHASFMDPAFVALARDRGAAICLADHETFPLIPDVTADFVYARLMRGSDDIETAYAPADLERWVDRARTFAAGRVPDDLPVVDRDAKVEARPRDVFAFIIHEGKVRAPAGAQAFLSILNRCSFPGTNAAA